MGKERKMRDIWYFWSVFGKSNSSISLLMYTHSIFNYNQISYQPYEMKSNDSFFKVSMNRMEWAWKEELKCDYWEKLVTFGNRSYSMGSSPSKKWQTAKRQSFALAVTFQVSYIYVTERLVPSFSCVVY